MSTGIYVHIPYCVQKCLYCGFVSYESAGETMRSYLSALVRDITDSAERYPDVKVDSIYFGGGTPSTFVEGGVATVIDCVAKYFHLDAPEITVECNPESLSRRIDEYILSGVNRISVGVQSLSDEVLRRIGRAHGSREARRALETATSRCRNVSADVMLGLPGDGIEGVVRTVEGILEFPVKHLSAYGLKVEEGTPLYDMTDLDVPDDDTQADCYDRVVELLEDRGLMRYEVSNFAYSGYESRHNMRYWRAGDYIGIGASAHGYMDGVRYVKPSTLGEYIANPTVRVSEERISPDESLFEHIMLGLRTREGIDMAEIERRFRIDFGERYREALTRDCYIRRGTRLSLKPEYYYCMNTILLDYMD